MRYRKRPVVIDAVQLTPETWVEALTFLGDDWRAADGPECTVHIRTLEGITVASRGDYIIRGVKGEHYACKPDIFALTYEPADP